MSTSETFVETWHALQSRRTSLNAQMTEVARAEDALRTCVVDFVRRVRTFVGTPRHSSPLRRDMILKKRRGEYVLGVKTWSYVGEGNYEDYENFLWVPVRWLDLPLEDVVREIQEIRARKSAALALQEEQRRVAKAVEQEEADLKTYERLREKFEGSTS